MPRTFYSNVARYLKVVHGVSLDRLCKHCNKLAILNVALFHFICLVQHLFAMFVYGLKHYFEAEKSRFYLLFTSNSQPVVRQVELRVLNGTSMEIKLRTSELDHFRNTAKVQPLIVS